MDFHECPTMYHGHKMNGGRRSVDDFYAWAFEAVERKADGDAEMTMLRQVRVLAERQYIKLRRPYYAVWPAVGEALTKVALTLPFSSLRLPLRALAIRFPVTKEPFPQMLSLLLARVDLETEFVLSLSINLGPPGNPSVAGTVATRHVMAQNVEDYLAELRVRPGERLADHVRGLATTTQFRQLNETAWRIAVGVCLLASDPDIVVPDVLAADRRRYQETLADKYIRRAHKRGKVGWNVGANIEFSPHTRRPHFGLRWTGKGRSVPKIVPIKGCIVKRSKLTEVPTGYQGSP